MTIGSLFDNLLRFIRNMVLAKLLAPEAFGLMATVIAAVAALEAVAEVGLQQAVIQNKKGADEDFLNIIWWLSSLRALTLYMIAYLATPMICNFFNKPESVMLLRMGFLVIVLNGFISPRIHVLQKELRFTSWVILMQSAGVLGILTGIISAYLLRDVWALVLAYLTEAFLRLVFSFTFYFFKPRLKFNLAYAREIMSFSRKIFGLPILMMLFIQTDVFVIGKILSLEALGMYSLARDLADIPNRVLTKINPLFLPTLSLMQDDRDRLRLMTFAFIKAIANFGAPFMAFFILFSKPILSTVYEPVYAEISVPFSILCVYGLILMSSWMIMNVFIAIGQPDIQRLASLARTVIFLLLIYPATKTFGLVGASSAALIAMSLCSAIQIFYLHKLINLTLYELLGSLTQGIKLSLVVIIPGILFKAFIKSQGMEAIGFGSLCCVTAWGIGVANLNLFDKSSSLHKTAVRD